MEEREGWFVAFAIDKREKVASSGANFRRKVNNGGEGWPH